MNCKYCGKKLQKNSKFCSNCGGKIEEEVKEAVVLKDIKEENNNNNNKVNKKTNGLLISSIIVTALSLLTLSFLGIIFGVIAIVFACMYKSENNQELSERKKYNTKIFNAISWVLFGVNLVIKIILGTLIASLFAFIITKFKENDISFERIRDYIENIEFYSENGNNNSRIYIKYNNIEDDYSNLTEIDYDKFINLYNSKNKSVVVLVQTNCGYCKMFKPVINEIAKSYDLNIYYLDISKLDDETYNKMTDEIDYLSTHEYWGTPTVLIVGKGKSSNYFEGYADYKTIKDFLSENKIIK